MYLTVEIKCCRACKNVDHSGSFTKGGARVICGHSDACKDRRNHEEFKNEYPEYYAKGDHKDSWKYHWFNRIIENPEKESGIPNWCPLKSGSAY